MTTIFSSDIDIDIADRDELLKVIKHVPAGIIRDGKLIKHNSGIYATNIPTDPYIGCSTIDYKEAEDRGYVKVDLLNVGVYKLIRDEAHLVEMMKEPNWEKLYDADFCSQLIHVSNHYSTLLKMSEPVNSIPRLAMFLALIRPGKRHLIGKPWKTIAKTIWEKPEDGEYFFKKSHSISYAQLVVVHMNLLESMGSSSQALSIAA